MALLDCQLTYHRAKATTKELCFQKTPFEERIALIRDWSVNPRQTNLRPCNQEVFLAFVWGEAFGKSLFAWASDLQWSGEITSADPGISFLELCVNCIITSGMEQPLLLGRKSKKQHQSYDWQKHSANFDTALRLLSSITQQDLLRFHMCAHPCSLQPYGDPRRVGGLRIRRMMRCQAETRDAIAEGYLASNNFSLDAESLASTMATPRSVLPN